MNFIMKMTGGQLNIPSECNLIQNYPNPFCVSSGRNIATSIDYVIKKSQNIKIDIYNIKGQKIINLVDKFSTPGKYTVNWNGYSKSGKIISSGVYFYKLVADDKTISSGKMMIIK